METGSMEAELFRIIYRQIRVGLEELSVASVIAKFACYFHSDYLNTYAEFVLSYNKPILKICKYNLKIYMILVKIEI